MNLFVIYIGGRAEGSLIELHDMRFVIASTIENTYTELRRSWWGIPESLHLDCWGILKSADNHHIHLKPEPVQSTKKLYFVNLGGYDASKFTELHKNIFVVAENEVEAKSNAVMQIQDWNSPHRDYLYDVENIHCLSDALSSKNLHIHLEPTHNPAPFEFLAEYIPIGG